MSEGMRILDLFCGAGGAAMGLHKAFPEAEIIGVDIKPQKNYPFTFVQGDAMEYPLEGFDFIWASPPCQGFSVITPKAHRGNHRNLITPMRKRLLAAETYWCMENVMGAPLDLDNSFVLCGQMFRLKLLRHRRFETNFTILVPFHEQHRRGMAIRQEVFTVCGSGGLKGSNKYQSGTKEQWIEAMGIDWMTKAELSQAIPPAYSEYIGNQLRTVMSHKKAANR